MNKFYLPLLAFVVGFIGAFITTGVHSLFFMLLPIMAFAFGYFSSWRRGLLYGFLLFAGYTFAISVIWYGIDSPNLLYPFPYISAFIAGGFSLLLIGAMAPMVKKGVRRFGSYAALVVLAIVVGWCGYSAIPHYGFYYQVAIQSPEYLNNIELYLPVGAVSGEPYAELYDEVYKIPGELTDKHLTRNFIREVVDTEQGKMLKLTIPGLKKDDVPAPRYTANIIFWQKRAPRELLHLMPKTEVQLVNTVTWRRLIGPVTSHESLIVERFKVPVKVVSDTQGQIKLTLWNRTDRGEAVNFTYSRSYSYTERISYNLQTGNEWVLIPVEATVVTDIRGISD